MVLTYMSNYQCSTTGLTPVSHAPPVHIPVFLCLSYSQREHQCTLVARERFLKTRESDKNSKTKLGLRNA